MAQIFGFQRLATTVTVCGFDGGLSLNVASSLTVTVTFLWRASADLIAASAFFEIGT
jgi:hypothetical protein